MPFRDYSYLISMINDDILIKFSLFNLERGYTPIPEIKNWVDYTRYLNKQIREIRDLDFKSIGLNDISLVIPESLGIGDRIILSDLNKPETDQATILGKILRKHPENNMIVELEVEGLGHKPDFSRDPERNITWGTKIYPNLENYSLLKLDSIPRINGGNVYYYFNKYPRDSRESIDLNFPIEFSCKAILGILKNMTKQNINDGRDKSQYLHFYRKNFKDLCFLLGNNQAKQTEYYNKLVEIYKVYIEFPQINKQTCLDLSLKISKIL